MNHETFTAWLARHVVARTLTGELARSVAKAPLPSEPKSLDDLLSGLVYRGFKRSVVDRAWRMYEKQRPSRVNAEWLALASEMLASCEGASTVVGGPTNEPARMRFATVAKYRAFCKAFDAMAARVKAAKKP